MVYRRTNRRRYRRTRKVPKYTKKRLIKSYLRKKAKRGNTVVSKLRFLQELSTTELSAGIAISMVSLNGAVIDPGTSSWGGSVLDWSNYTGLYDNYRPCAVKIQIIPNQNVSTHDTTYSQYVPLYSCVDYDNTQTTTKPTVSDMNEYENCKFHNLYRPIKRYYRIPKYTSQSSDTGNNVTVIQKGYYPTARATNDSSGIIYLRCPANPTSGLNVNLRLTYYVAFKNRK